MEQEQKQTMEQMQETKREKSIPVKTAVLIAATVAAIFVVGVAGFAIGWRLAGANAPSRVVYTEASDASAQNVQAQNATQMEETTQAENATQESTSDKTKRAPSGNEKKQSRDASRSGKAQQSEIYDTSDYISVEEAKAIALTYANLTNESDAQITKAKLDREDGRIVYEIEYFVGTTEYDIDVDAVTGNVVDVDIDYNEWFD